jgi:hypothetical protein
MNTKNLTEIEKKLYEVAERLKWNTAEIQAETGNSEWNTKYLLYDLMEKCGILPVNPKTPKAVKECVEMVKDESTTIGMNKVDLKDINSFVPTKLINYVKRSVDEDIEFWAEGINERGYREAISLVGEAGSGKNQAIMEYARNHNLPCLIIPCDDSQILNQMLGYWQAKNGSTIWKEGLLVNFITQPAVVVFDEVNSLPSSRLFMLHELLENRKLFSKDAPADKSMVEVHTDCRIFLAMNPPTSGYSGTNRLNIALANRSVFLQVPDFTIEQMNIDTGDKAVDKQIGQFYNDVKRIIKEQHIRFGVSIRNVNRAVSAYKNGASTERAIVHGFINSALATTGEMETNSLKDLARTIFGASAIDGNRDAMDNIDWN